ncbi:MAG TPA: protein-L-isoaspartate(D-aspartate) O-methyltransferase [Paraburkholderia sp.]|jgi:protein-L-isoaspartate(D-aspartate) O-methyltransferase|nr:protein-L-isoaspartate(D-aspartate) O-methyltransferase [Paraburkholderia sp.]
MTGERAKRFPLGLEDLVREPRRSEGRPGDARNVKPQAALADARAAKAPLPALPERGAKPQGAPKPVARGPKPQGSTLTDARAAKPQGAALSDARSTPRHHPPLAEARAAQSKAAISTGARSDNPRQPPLRLPAAPLERAGAPNVPLTRAHALTSERVRERMVERLRANGVADPRVLHAMATVPRHMFIDPGLATQAYEDAALPIGHHQTISKPSVVARMIELAAAGRTLGNVLEIGTGCGYQAAVLSQVARDVYSIERIKPLYERAKTNLRPLRIPNIRLHYGDGRVGLPNAAPFDAIVIAAAGLDVPQALLEQLAIGARLVAPVGTHDGQTQVLTLVERTGPAQWRESRLDRVFFVPLKSGVI